MSGKEEEKVVGDALDRLVRQDPSLRLEWPKMDVNGQLEDPEAQTLLHGMGPLHLEISLRRLEDEQGVKARAGAMRVSMRESVREGGGPTELVETWEGAVVGVQGNSEATVKLEIERLTDAELAELRENGEGENLADWAGNDVTIDIPTDSPLAALESSISSSLLSAITRGGPLMSLPLSHLRVHLTPCLDASGETELPPSSIPTSSKSPSSKQTSPKSSSSKTTKSSAPPPTSTPPPAAFARAIHSALRKAIQLAHPTILEPLVETKIWGVSQADVGKVVTDLIGRGGQVSELGDEDMSSIGSKSSSGSSSSLEEDLYLPPSWISPSASSSLSLMSAERVQRRTVLASVPLAEMGSYAGKLRSLSGGGGVFESKEGGWGDVDLGTVRRREERDSREEE